MSWYSIINPLEIYNFIDETILKRPKLNFELGRHTITNHFYDQEGTSGSSSVEILLELSNSGRKPLGISKILVNVRDDNYFIEASSYE